MKSSMIVMADLTSSFLADLGAFLREPVIKLCVSDEVESLRKQLSTLQRDYDELRLEHDRVTSNYRDLTIRCLDLQDILREHGIKWR